MLANVQAMAVPLQKALQIGLQQPRIAEIALAALESCPADVAARLAPLIGPNINPYMNPVSLKRFEEPTRPGKPNTPGLCWKICTSGHGKSSFQQ